MTTNPEMSPVQPPPPPTTDPDQLANPTHGVGLQQAKQYDSERCRNCAKNLQDSGGMVYIFLHLMDTRVARNCAGTCMVEGNGAGTVLGEQCRKSAMQREERCYFACWVVPTVLHGTQTRYNPPSSYWIWVQLLTIASDCMPVPLACGGRQHRGTRRSGLGLFRTRPSVQPPQRCLSSLGRAHWAPQLALVEGTGASAPWQKGLPACPC